ncbi:hypothetical protein AA2016_5568 (plasmid) [Aminobacter aminovorans]|uniref:Uncharacterized protein n=1 Tax=Aminobacter aminovorans TaxID=83263 RepID=A0AAC9AT32_AMIAI|nr:hypothetical protein AA2016_5568 [Aminobacter aminovorans]
MHQRARKSGGRFALQAFRSQYNTTVYGLDDRYRGVYGEREVIFIHPDDLEAIGARAGDRVDVVGAHDDGIERVARNFRFVPYDVPRGSLAGYYSRAQRARAALQRRHRKRHADIQVDHGVVPAPRGPGVVSDGAFMAAVEQVLQVYPDLSKLQAAVVAADEMDIAQRPHLRPHLWRRARAGVAPGKCVGRGRGLAEDHQARAKDNAHALCRELVTETKRSIPIARWG